MHVAARTLISPPTRESGKYREQSVAFAAVIVSVLYAPSVWATETAWEILERFGLRGTWATSCDQPATPKSFHTIFVKGTDGLAVREIDYGAGFPIRLTIVESAQLISPSKLKIRVRNADPNWGKTNNVIHEAVMIKESDPKTNEIVRIRVIESILSDGTVLVKDGILKSLGKPSFWSYKCRSAMS
ncbi:hypothetical protein [Bradyrhizobium macuxiense]|uniref:hypothetical protein n=1 Tax=Bradyrhizobium macuxiense TaxID=1755647 RepID=UPI0011BEB2A8|nr:hypothetical protein [Bradyrhizobium macuxiense]